MGSVKARVRQFPVPGEPGEWFGFRRLSDAELDTRPDLSTDNFTALAEPEKRALTFRWLEATLRAWSYEEPCTIEVVRAHLDRPTLVWAFLTTLRHTHGRETSEEKKADSPDSTATSTGSPAPVAPTPGS